jgi:hypothetical protein
MADLRAHPPAVLVDTSGVTGLGYGAFPMSSNRQLFAFANSNYVPTTFEGYSVWWVKAAACSAGHVPHV